MCWPKELQFYPAGYQELAKDVKRETMTLSSLNFRKLTLEAEWRAVGRKIRRDAVRSGGEHYRSLRTQW